MSSKASAYRIYLSDVLIGTSALEYGDPPMGVAFGMINFISLEYGYDYILKYCYSNNIELPTLYEDVGLFVTGEMSTMKVIGQNGQLIKGVTQYIEATKVDGVQVSVCGIPHPFYAQEFPHHRIEYDKK